MIGVLIMVYLLGMVCGWFACTHMAELDVMAHDDLAAAQAFIVKNYSADQKKCADLLEELALYAKDTAVGFGGLSEELQHVVNQII